MSIKKKYNFGYCSSCNNFQKEGSVGVNVVPLISFPYWWSKNGKHSKILFCFLGYLYQSLQNSCFVGVKGTKKKM